MDRESKARLLLESNDASAEPTDLPLSLLITITDNFSDDQIIGRGGFGVVYKGLLQSRTVAVKKMLSLVNIDEKYFMQEVTSMMSVKHKNIVRFLGYCADTQEKIVKYNGKMIRQEVRERVLCFEYMPNGNLHGYITDASKGHIWRTGYQIIKGICEGLHYIHQKKIVHLDLKPANILLDYNMVPKIADFGLAKCFGEEQSRTITSTILGSLGYCAPEYASRGEITLKSDIYSLGVVLIEILTGKKHHTSINIDDVLQSWSSRFGKSQGDTDLEHVRVCTEIALECLDTKPENRPNTQRILDRLNEVDQKCGFLETDEGTSSALHASSELIQSLSINLGKLHLASEFTCLATSDLGSVEWIDVHPAETWILVAHRDGCVCIWNYQKQEKLMEKRVARWTEDSSHKRLIFSAKFIAREQCFATGVGDDVGLVRVYSYTTKAKVTEFEAHGGEPVSSLVVHSTEPFLLTASYEDKWIKVWNWAQSWKCTQKIDAHERGVRSLTFDQRDANTYASASRDDYVKVWHINSSDPIISKLDMPCSHYCDFFIVNHRHFLVTFSSIKQCAYIWDLQTKKRVHELVKICGVACHPTLPILATVTNRRFEGPRVCLRDVRTYRALGWRGSVVERVTRWRAGATRCEEETGLRVATMTTRERDGEEPSRPERRLRTVSIEDSPIRGMAFTCTKELTRLIVPCQRGISIVEIKLPEC